MSIENFNVSVISNGITYDTNANIQVGTTYEEFLKAKPDVNSLGEIWYDLFKDAVRSCVLNTAKLNKFDYLVPITNDIIDASVRYARIYFCSKDGDRALLILKGVLRDLVNQYDYNSNKAATDLIFKLIVELIKA